MTAEEASSHGLIDEILQPFSKETAERQAAAT